MVIVESTGDEEADDDLEVGWPENPLDRAVFEATMAEVVASAYRALLERRGQEARML